MASWARWAMLVAGALTLATQTHSYVSTRQRVTQLELRAAQMPAPAGIAAVKSRDPKHFEAQITAIERVVNRLTFDWHVLFKELERTTTQEIALTSIEPEPDRRSLMVSGVARDYPALLTYVSTLRSSAVLNNVFLKKHETARNQPQQGVVFTIVAGWRELERQANAASTPAN